MNHEHRPHGDIHHAICGTAGGAGNSNRGSRIAYKNFAEALVRTVLPAAGFRAPAQAPVRAVRDAAPAYSPLQFPRQAGASECTDDTVPLYGSCGIDVVELAGPEYIARPLAQSAPDAPQTNPVRSTFPGSTTFKSLANSYLRKLLRGQAPDALYWVANATLPNGERVLARLRFTVVVEDLSVEALSDPRRTPATVELSFAAPITPKN